ncbi:hypothetical protein V1478_006711 [Vespula squamosa]|uniref:Uncharacterized protein n=1 Tax=Vespula squamosa TaxID=30214 RepID=A0ABD2B0P8_VESSQ
MKAARPARDANRHSFLTSYLHAAAIGQSESSVESLKSRLTRSCVPWDLVGDETLLTGVNTETGGGVKQSARSGETSDTDVISRSTPSEMPAVSSRRRPVGTPHLSFVTNPLWNSSVVLAEKARRKRREAKRREAKRREEKRRQRLYKRYLPTLRPWYNYQQQQGDKEGRVEEGRDLRGSGAKKEGGRVEMTVRLNEVRHSSYFVSCDARRLGYIYSSNGTTHSDPNEIKWLRLSFRAEPQQKQVKYGRRLERADWRVIETYTKAEYKRNRGTVNKAGVRESRRFRSRAKYRYLRGGGSAVCALVFVSFRQSGIRALEASVHRSRKTSWTGTTSTATLKAARLPLSVRITMSDLFGRLNSGAAGNNVGRAGNMEIAEHR